MTDTRGPDAGKPDQPAFDAIHLPGFAARDPARPLVVAIEGPNGAGKSTLCQMLSQKLKAPACLGTDPAWFSSAFKERMIREAEWYASAMFFLSGCFEQMRRLRGRPEPMVIMDRSLWSTLAVHAAAQGERLHALLSMLRPVAAHIQVPDLTLVLEASFATCQSRIGRKSGMARALDELTASPPFHEGEKAFYRWLGRELTTVKFLDVNNLAPGEVAEGTLALLRQTFRC